MKAPDMNALSSLAKAPVSDPIIAGTTGTASTAGMAGTHGTANLAGMTAKTKFTIRLDKELMGRIRAAYLADLAAGIGVGSLSDWAAEHLARIVRDTEQRLNRDKPFIPVGTGTVPRMPLGTNSH